MERYTSERDFVARYILRKMEEAVGVLDLKGIVRLSIETKVDGGTADLCADRSGKRLLVLEAKFKKNDRDIEPRDPEVIKQAVGYAVHGGFPYYLTTNTRRIILFQLQPGKKPFESEITSFEFEKDTNWAEEILKVVLGQVAARLKPLDDTLVDTLHEAFNDLYPEFLSAFKERTQDKAFRKKYEEWLESQGLQIEDETNRLIAEQSTYLQLNKLLFYQVIRTIYPDKLDPLVIAENEDVQEVLERFYEKAKRIDYASVYESDVISEIPLTRMAKERLRTLIDTLGEFDFSSMKSDFLGRVYEKLIPPAERKRLGQFYTPPGIADLIVRLTIRDRGDLILDPGCGSGTFLVKAYQRLRELKGFGDEQGPLYEEQHREVISQLYGIDLNQFPAHLSVINLSIQNPAARVDKVNIVVKDFFDIQAGQETIAGFESMTASGEGTTIRMPETFDVVVANPPYIRQELLGNREKNKIRKRVESEYSRKVYVGDPHRRDRSKNVIVLDRQSDIYVYFCLHGLAMLKQGGMLGFITSNKWLEVGYGKPFQEFLLRNVKISYIIEFDRAVFPDAEVDTAIVILEKEKGEQARNENTIKFVRLKQKTSIEETLRILSMAEESYEDEKVRINVVKQGSLTSGKWNVYLRAPPVYQKIANHPKMKPLGEIAKVFRGITTGYNDYFILNEEKAKEWGIEKRFLVPCVSSPKKLKGLIVRPEDVNEYFFMVGEDEKVPIDSNAYKYIQYGERLEVEVTRGSQRGKRRLPELETVKNRKKWFSLPLLEVADILLPYMVRERFMVWLNNAKAHTPNVFHYLVLNNSDEVMLAGYLNSSIAKFLCELKGRQYTGMLKMETYEWNEFLSIDWNLIPASEKNQVSNLFYRLAELVDQRAKLEEKHESFRSRSKVNKGVLDYELEQKLEEARQLELNAQKELDEAIYDILGLSKNERRQVEDGLKELQEIRRMRTKT